MTVDRLFGNHWDYIEELRQRVTALNLRASRSRAKMLRREDLLESGLLRVSMAVRAMAELCIAKGLFTAEEFAQQLTEADFADGVLDGGLDPQLVEPGKRRLAELAPLESAGPRVPVVRRKSAPSSKRSKRR